jgi:hypothetical protein
MRTFNSVVILAALIALMILIVSFCATWRGL